MTDQPAPEPIDVHAATEPPTPPRRSRRQQATIAAGGVVVHKDRVLLARLTYSRAKGMYMLPGGYVDPGEMIDEAVVRETFEETGVTAMVEGLIGVRARLQDEESNTYCLFKLTYVSGTPRPEGHENDDVRWFGMHELEDAASPLVAIARVASLAVLRGDAQVIPLHPPVSGLRVDDERLWRLYL